MPEKTLACTCPAPSCLENTSVHAPVCYRVHKTWRQRLPIYRMWCWQSFFGLNRINETRLHLARAFLTFCVRDKAMFFAVLGIRNTLHRSCTLKSVAAYSPCLYKKISTFLRWRSIFIIERLCSHLVTWKVTKSQNENPHNFASDSGNKSCWRTFELNVGNVIRPRSKLHT